MNMSPVVQPMSIFPAVAFFPVFIALAAFPAFVSAAPSPLLSKRQNQGNGPNNNGSSNGNISMNVWLPIILVTVVFVLFSLLACIRRCAAADSTSSTSANRTTSTPANSNRPYRRPRRTPSQISTKSLPAYMKEPGDQELVLFRGPAEMSMDDDMVPPHPMPILAEEDMPEMRGATFGIALGPTESVDTMPDSSTTNLMRRMSVPRPPELHHTTMPSDDRQSGDTHSMDSTGSDVELLVTRQQRITAETRGEAPSYTEAVSAERNVPTISLNDPEPDNGSSSITVPPSAVRRSRFSFLKQNPFSSHNHTHGGPSNVDQPSSATRSESPAVHVRSGSALSRLSTRESHDSHHSRPSSRNNISHSRSNSNLLRAFRPHSPGLHPGSSTISLDSISAPLPHTLTRAEFHAPKGGLTPEQIKLITSREALERFGVPYGPNAVAAFSLPRETGPPPTFDSVTVEQSGSGGSATGTEQRSEDADTALPRSTSPPPPSSSSSDERAGSRTSTLVSYTTVPDGDTFRGETVYMYGPEVEDEPLTARPMTPRPARPLSGP